MGDKLLLKIVRPYIISAVILFAPGLIFLLNPDVMPPYYARTHHPADYILIACAAIFVVACFIIRAGQRRWIVSFLEGVENEVEDTIRYSVKNHPMPICVVNSEGKLVLTNGKFKDNFPAAKVLKTDIEEITGLKRAALEPDGSGGAEDHSATEPLQVVSGGKSWLVLTSYLNADISKSVMLYFIDITDFEALKARYAEEKQCFAYVIVDNYDELLSKSSDGRKPAIAAGLETAVRDWGSTLDAIVIRQRKDRYQLIFDRKHYRMIEEDAFTVLDTVRGIETDAEFPASFSIGVGVDGETLSVCEGYAAFALDLALGRGGDQAVVKKGSDVAYYGGKMQVIESRNKGKSRVMAHALKQLIAQSARVIVMGHKNPDMDSLGACVGISHIAFAHRKDAYIVRGEVGYSMQDVFAEAVKSGSYSFVSAEEALKLADEDTLLVVVDAHTPGMLENKHLLSRVGRLVVIDHHRKKEDYIDGATLSFMDPNASSTSELIAEIMQYDDKVTKINKLEANLMLAGIFVDTNSFSVKTGTRTFEAASWLRENGGDSMAVRKFLQNDMSDFKQRANIISNAEFNDKGIAISRNEGKHANAQIIVAQAADELLDIKGIRASFVVGETKKEVVISARSLGGLNVQTIMERFGGGGHLTMAAAQVSGETQTDVIARLKQYIQEADK
jgi:c-di-AMP phosphodiesterase-like protein